jgi:hypothetical protein
VNAMTQIDIFEDLTDEEIRKINDVCGIEVFQRLDALPTELYNKFRTALEKGKVNLHCDGYLGFTVDQGNAWSNEGFEL